MDHPCSDKYLGLGFTGPKCGTAARQNANLFTDSEATSTV